MMGPSKRTRTTADTDRKEPPMQTLKTVRAYARYALTASASVAFLAATN
jgi:hypothetical protein